MASPNCFRLLAHLMRPAASRTFCTAGTSSPIKIAMIAMTTKSSISVNARVRRARSMGIPPIRENENVTGHTTYRYSQLHREYVSQREVTIRPGRGAGYRPQDRGEQVLSSPLGAH